VSETKKILTREESAVLAMAECNEKFGKGTVMPLNQSRASEPVDVISTRNKEIDKITGIDGIPRGRITEIFGPESGGKTTLALHLIAEAQAQGGTAAFIDAEHALDPEYARALGVNVEAMYCSQPDCGEYALETALILINSGAFTIVVVDSVAALVPKAELEADMDEQQMGLQGRMMSKAMRKLNGTVKRTNTSLVFINQIRDKIGVMFGSPETTTGGRALKFFASMRIDVRRISSEKKGDKIVGNETKVKIAKNKLAAPFKECKPILMFGKGFIND
jgi:recombination protein RecA